MQKLFFFAILSTSLVAGANTRLAFDESVCLCDQDPQCFVKNVYAASQADYPVELWTQRDAQNLDIFDLAHAIKYFGQQWTSDHPGHDKTKRLLLMEEVAARALEMQADCFKAEYVDSLMMHLVELRALGLRNMFPTELSAHHCDQPCAKDINLQTRLCDPLGMPFGSFRGPQSEAMYRLLGEYMAKHGGRLEIVRYWAPQHAISAQSLLAVEAKHFFAAQRTHDLGSYWWGSKQHYFGKSLLEHMRAWAPRLDFEQEYLWQILYTTNAILDEMYLENELDFHDIIGILLQYIGTTELASSSAAGFSLAKLAFIYPEVNALLEARVLENQKVVKDDALVEAVSKIVLEESMLQEFYQEKQSGVWEMLEKYSELNTYTALEIEHVNNQLEALDLFCKEDASCGVFELSDKGFVDSGMFSATLTIWHAFMLELLDAVDMPNNERTSHTVCLFRAMPKSVLEMNGIYAPARNLVANRAAYECASIAWPWDETPAHLTVQRVPHHRVVMVYLLGHPDSKKHPEANVYDAPDWASEFIFLTDSDSKFDYIARPGDDLDPILERLLRGKSCE